MSTYAFLVMSSEIPVHIIRILEYNKYRVYYNKLYGFTLNEINSRFSNLRVYKRAGVFYHGIHSI